MPMFTPHSLARTHACLIDINIVLVARKEFECDFPALDKDVWE